MSNLWERVKSCQRANLRTLIKELRKLGATKERVEMMSFLLLKFPINCEEPCKK